MRSATRSMFFRSASQNHVVSACSGPLEKRRLRLGRLVFYQDAPYIDPWRDGIAPSPVPPS